MTFMSKMAEMLRLNQTPVPVLPAWASYNKDRKRVEVDPADAYADILSRYTDCGQFKEHAPNVYWMEVAYHTVKRVIMTAIAESDFAKWEIYIRPDPEVALLNFQKNRTVLKEQSEAARKGWLKHFKVLTEKSQWI